MLTQALGAATNMSRGASGVMERLLVKKGGEFDDALPPPPQSARFCSATLRGFLCVVGGCLAHFTFGSVYCWANFNSYAPAELRSDFVFPLTVVAQCLTMPFGPIIVKKLGARATLLLGCWVMSSGVYLSSFAKNLTSFTFCYSIMFGCGVGISYAAPMMAGWSWLPNSKGLISGAILTGFGIGGFFFNILSTSMINPKGVDPIHGVFPDEIKNQFPVMLRRLALIYTCISAFGALLITEPVAVVVTADEEIGYENDKDKERKSLAAEVLGVTIMEALNSSQFWLMWLMIITSASAGLNVASMYKQFASLSPVLKGDSYQALTGGMGALFNGFGRLFWGSICDRIGFKTSFTILTLAQACIQLLYPYSPSSKVIEIFLLCAVINNCDTNIFATYHTAAQELTDFISTLPPTLPSSTSYSH